MTTYQIAQTTQGVWIWYF